MVMQNPKVGDYYRSDVESIFKILDVIDGEFPEVKMELMDDHGGVTHSDIYRDPLDEFIEQLEIGNWVHLPEMGKKKGVKKRTGRRNIQW